MMRRLSTLALLALLAVAPAAQARLTVTNLSGFGGGGGAPPVFVSQNVTAGSGSGTKTHNLPANIVSGNLLILCLYDRGGTATFSTYSPTFTELFDTNGIVCAYRTADGTEGATMTVSHTGNNRWASATLQFSGWTGTPESSVSLTAGGVDPPSITPTFGGATTYLAVVVSTSTSDITAGPSNYLNFQTIRGANDPSIATATKQSDIGGTEDPGSFTCSCGTSTSRQVTLAIQGQ